MTITILLFAFGAWFLTEFCFWDPHRKSVEGSADRRRLFLTHADSALEELREIPLREKIDLLVILTHEVSAWGMVLIRQKFRSNVLLFFIAVFIFVSDVVPMIRSDLAFLKGWMAGSD